MGESSRRGRRLLVALDGGRRGRAALAWALDFLLDPRDELHLLHVLPLPSIMDPGPAFPLSASAVHLPETSRSLEANNLMKEAISSCLLRQVDATGEVAVGDAGESLCMAAIAMKADLLVLGSHERGTFSRLLIGSVSDYCVHLAHCPVLVVKAFLA
eukprot:SM000028S10138  [mRNA]  locus=s28:557313:558721:- [translate_table: standard]